MCPIMLFMYNWKLLYQLCRLSGATAATRESCPVTFHAGEGVPRIIG
jgi:hypothetical protein